MQVFSDGETSFKSAHSSILEWIKSWGLHLIQKEFPRTQFDFKWKFNVPYASHMNGIVESLIRSVRKGLDAAILNYTTCSMTFEEWQTVLYEVTYVTNSRPMETRLNLSVSLEIIYCTHMDNPNFHNLPHRNMMTTVIC